FYQQTWGPGPLVPPPAAGEGFFLGPAVFFRPRRRPGFGGAPPLPRRGEAKILPACRFLRHHARS
ncbi:MAG: hypothetical protein NZ602_13760, partial [Thermoguttaceae bacterium]|nr:hypothetical protein [Thermoguttaceae bacterium]